MYWNRLLNSHFLYKCQRRAQAVRYLFIGIQQFYTYSSGSNNFCSLYTPYIYNMFMAHFHTACLHTSTIPKKVVRVYDSIFFVGKHVQYGHEQHRRRGSSGRGRKAAAAHRGVRRSCGSQRASSSAQTRRVVAARPVTADTQPNKKLKRPNKKESHRR